MHLGITNIEMLRKAAGLNDITWRELGPEEEDSGPEPTEQIRHVFRHAQGPFSLLLIERWGLHPLLLNLGGLLTAAMGRIWRKGHHLTSETR